MRGEEWCEREGRSRFGGGMNESGRWRQGGVADAVVAHTAMRGTFIVSSVHARA